MAKVGAAPGSAAKENEVLPCRVGALLIPNEDGWMVGAVALNDLLASAPKLLPKPNEVPDRPNPGAVDKLVLPKPEAGVGEPKEGAPSFGAEEASNPKVGAGAGVVPSVDPNDKPVLVEGAPKESVGLAPNVPKDGVLVLAVLLVLPNPLATFPNPTVGMPAVPVPKVLAGAGCPNVGAAEPNAGVDVGGAPNKGVC